MRAVVTRFNRDIGTYQVRTDNDIAIAFAIRDGTRLELSEIIEVDLQNLVTNQTVVRVSDSKVVLVKLGAHDLHDLRLPSGHGTSRLPNAERLAGG